MQSAHLVPAHPDQKPAIANLIQLYLHDMTEFMPFPVGDDGLYQYDFLDRFWRHPYFIMADNEIAGFALVVDECPLTGRTPCWFMAEFFVLKAYRGGAPAKPPFNKPSLPTPANGTSPSHTPTRGPNPSGPKPSRRNHPPPATSTSTVTTGDCMSLCRVPKQQ